MRWLDRCGDDAEAVAAIHDLLVTGRNAAALRSAERALITMTNLYARATVHVNRVCALVDLGRTTQYTAAVDEAFAAIRELAEPYPHGHLHALAALAARQQGAPERSVTHLVHSSRMLERVTDIDDRVAWGWHDLATAYSYLGFHGYALSAIERARGHAARVGLDAELFAQPGIRLRMALAMDHNGDTDGCLRVLRDVGGELDRYAAGRLRPTARVSYGYALARRAALGESWVGAHPRSLLAAGAEGQTARDARSLGDVCLMIAAGKATDALNRLETLAIAPGSLGQAEPTRLRSIAFAVAGDHAAAHQADRHAFRLASQRTDRLREVFLEGIATRLDHEHVRRSAAEYDDSAALTDPLTGLPNQRHLDRYLATLIARGDTAMMGTVDLDGLAQVNAAHGRLSGDLVLQRVGGVVARILRRGDFVARPGSDEFIVVLTGASAAQAKEVARRIREAVSAEDWEALVPGTRIGVTVTWQSVPG